MKKIYLLIVAAVFILTPFAGAMTTISSDTQILQQSSTIRTSSSLSHTVFVEEGTTTWCPNCPTAAEALYNLYINNSEIPFYYVALVVDQSKVPKDRFSWHYGGRAIPTVFFDGGFIQQVGAASTVPLTEQQYRQAIEDCGARTVQPLNITSIVTGQGNAKLAITITITNNGDKSYFGYVHSYVTEIVSRWHDFSGDAYHFAMLDYALKKIVLLGPQKSKTYTVNWDGAAKHGNLTFPDIVDNNIMVITTGAHWAPHVVVKEQYVSTHVAFYVDQVAASTVSP